MTENDDKTTQLLLGTKYGLATQGDASLCACVPLTDVKEASSTLLKPHSHFKDADSTDRIKISKASTV